MECPICYTNAPTYVINCGSAVEHKVCDTCEVTMRMKEPETSNGRLLKCPMCRVTEKEPGERSSFSYKYALDQLYMEEDLPMLLPVLPRLLPMPSDLRRPSARISAITRSYVASIANA